MNRKSNALSSLCIAAGLVGLVPIASGAVYTNDFTDWGGADLTLQNGDIIAGVHSNLGHFAVAASATVTVKPYSAGAFGRATIMAASAAIHGTLSANAAGYPSMVGDGAATYRSGGGYGGRGNFGFYGVSGNVYGSAWAPDELGSGGGNGNNTSTPGGSGGGCLILDVVGALSIEGTISADGGNAAFTSSGGGSGGSIWLKAAVISGEGEIRADGGKGGSNVAAGGGGGRIALETADNCFAGRVQAQGKTGPYNPGRHGTLNFLPDPDLDLVIEADIALPPGTNWVFRSLTVRSNVVFDIQSTLGIAPAYANEQASRLRILGDVTIEADAALRADGQGYRTGQGPGAGTVRAGAGHGGVGGKGNHANGVPGGTYGASNAPVRLGSGGGLGSQAAGDGGGGLILEVAGKLTVQGTLSADGGEGGYRAGGGSGGSLWLTATSVRGEGTISVNGGDGYVADGGGGGGGGRLLLSYGWIEGFETRPDLVLEAYNPPALPETLAFGGEVTAAGGAGVNNGGEGSRLFRHVPLRPMGTLMIVR